VDAWQRLPYTGILPGPIPSCAAPSVADITSGAAGCKRAAADQGFAAAASPLGHGRATAAVAAALASEIFGLRRSSGRGTLDRGRWRAAIEPRIARR